MTGKTYDDRIAALKDRKRTIDAQIRELEARIAEAKRKADTHRKVLLGAMVLSRAEAGDPGAQRVMIECVEHMSARDRAAFEDLDMDWLVDVLRELRARDEQAAEPTTNATGGNDHGE